MGQVAEWMGRSEVGFRAGELELGLGRRKKQVPPDKTRDSRRLSGARRCARNDTLRVFRRVAEGWLWLRDSALPRVEAARRSEEPHP